MANYKFPYGFKAHAERISLEVRSDLSLQKHEPACPWKIAKDLSVSIINIEDLPKNSAMDYLVSSKGKSEFHATVCYIGAKAFIINSEVHSNKRQASNIAHELAHILLRHPPTKPFDEDGKRDFLLAIEKEAEWLGPALLVSEPAALFAYRLISSGKQSLAEISDNWNITEDVIKMRMNVVGASRRSSRSYA